MKDLIRENDAIEWLGVTYKTLLSPEYSGGAMFILDSGSPAGSRRRAVPPSGLTR